MAKIKKQKARRESARSPRTKNPGAKNPGAQSPNAQNPGDEESRDAILLCLLPDVAFDGWTEAGLMAAAERAGFPASKAYSLFPNGARDALAHFHDWADRKMILALEAMDLQTMRVRDRIEAGVLARLQALQPWREAVRKGAGVLALPPAAFETPRLVWRTADRLWWQAGDTATDYNHYTKRLLLSGVLVSTTLCWLNDDSPGMEKTRAFLARRIEAVLKIGQAIGKRWKKSA